MGPHVGAEELADGAAQAGMSEERAELLRLLATRLYRDHDYRPDGTQCVTCRQPWPCSGRRLAELGLIRAAPTPGGG